MKKLGKKFAAVATMSLVGLGLLVPVTSASAGAGFSCGVTSATIGNYYGRVAGAGYASCGGYNGTTSNVLFELRTFHNYDWVPDAVVSHVASWRSVPPGQSYPNIYVQRCDNSTTADYYSQASMQSEGSYRTSGTARITTCAGTGI